MECAALGPPTAARVHAPQGIVERTVAQQNHALLDRHLLQATARIAQVGSPVRVQNALSVIKDSTHPQALPLALHVQMEGTLLKSLALLFLRAGVAWDST